MARSLRVEFEGAIYHVTARGSDRHPIFLDDRDHRRFIEKLGENVDTHAIRLYAYVLMTNHYHLLIETPRANLSAFMQQFNTSYTAYFNPRHRRCGHLFEGRYKAKLVDADPYLLSLTRYIHLNPVRISSCNESTLSEKLHVLRNFKWSSHLAYCGSVSREEFVDYEPLLSLVAKSASCPEVQYREYVESGLSENDIELQKSLVRSSKAIGQARFCRWVETEYIKRAEQTGRMQDASMRRIEVGIAPDVVLKRVCRYFHVTEESLKKKRNAHVSRVVAMKLLKDCSGLNHRSIAVMLGIVDGSGVSKKISNLDALMVEDGHVLQVYEMLKRQLLNH